MSTGDSVEDYILSVNVHRRHITKGAQAMAKAIVYPEAMTAEEAGKLGGRGKGITSGNAFNNKMDITETVSAKMLSQARLVLAEFGPDSDIVNAVMAGGSLKDAYNAAFEQWKGKPFTG